MVTIWHAGFNALLPAQDWPTCCALEAASKLKRQCCTPTNFMLLTTSHPHRLRKAGSSFNRSCSTAGRTFLSLLKKDKGSLLLTYTQAVACANPRAHTPVLQRLESIIYSQVLEGMLPAFASNAPLDLSYNCSTYAYHNSKHQVTEQSARLQ